MPADAAPLNQQFIRLLMSEGTTPDFPVSVYKRGGLSYDSILSTPFVRINKNFELLPNGALSYETSKDGKTWTFHMDPKLNWSDGNPVTADDVVYTFQYQADPKHAWDFAWFWSDIVNWNDAVAGKVALDQIGVKKVDTYTVQFTTTVPSPYFPSKALYIRPLSKIAMQKYGEYYDTDPKTSVSSSPWILTEWTKGKQMVFGPNKNYTGRLKPYIQNLIIEFGDDNTSFNAYQNGEVDEAQFFSPADMATIAKDPTLNAEYHPGYGDFRTYYLGFNTSIEAVQRPEGAPGIREGDRPRLHHQEHRGKAGHCGLFVPHAGIPRCQFRGAEERGRQQVRRGCRPEAAGCRGISRREGVPRPGDVGSL